LYAPFDRLTYIAPRFVHLLNKEADKSKAFVFKKQTTDRGKTATTTVSTIEKDEQDVEQHQILESYHKNIAIMKNELNKRGAIKRKMVKADDPATEALMASLEQTVGKTMRRENRGTLGIDSTNV